MKENKDYRMIPAQDGDTQIWEIRILDGEFIETVFKFDAVQIDGENEQIIYNFTVVESPNPDAEETNEDLQKTVGQILVDIIDNSIQDGTAEFTEPNES